MNRMIRASVLSAGLLLVHAGCKADVDSDEITDVSELGSGGGKPGSASGFSASLRADLAKDRRPGGRTVGSDDGSGSGGSGSGGSGSGGSGSGGSGVLGAGSGGSGSGGSGSGGSGSGGSGSGGSAVIGAGSGVGAPANPGSGSAGVAIKAGSGGAGSAAPATARSGSGAGGTATAGSGSGSGTGSVADARINAGKGVADPASGSASAPKSGSGAAPGGGVGSAAAAKEPAPRVGRLATGDLAAIKLSLLPNWERDVDAPGTFSLLVKIQARNDSAKFKFTYGYDAANAPTDREAYKKFLGETRLLTVTSDRQRGAAWYLEGTDSGGNPAFRVVVSYGGKRLVCYGSLYRDSSFADYRDEVLIQAKKICETLAL